MFNNTRFNIFVPFTNSCHCHVLSTIYAFETNSILRIYQQFEPKKKHFEDYQISRFFVNNTEMKQNNTLFILFLVSYSDSTPTTI